MAPRRELLETKYYAIVFDDWDVATVEFEKEKMSLFP